MSVDRRGACVRVSHFWPLRKGVYTCKASSRQCLDGPLDEAVEDLMDGDGGEAAVDVGRWASGRRENGGKGSSVG